MLKRIDSYADLREAYERLYDEGFFGDHYMTVLIPEQFRLSGNGLLALDRQRLRLTDCWDARDDEPRDEDGWSERGERRRDRDALELLFYVDLPQYLVLGTGAGGLPCARFYSEEELTYRGLRDLGLDKK